MGRLYLLYSIAERFLNILPDVMPKVTAPNEAIEKDVLLPDPATPLNLGTPEELQAEAEQQPRVSFCPHFPASSRSDAQQHRSGHCAAGANLSVPAGRRLLNAAAIFTVEAKPHVLIRSRSWLSSRSIVSS